MTENFYKTKDKDPIILKTKEYKLFKEELLIQQNHRCKICNVQFDSNNPPHLDHQHATKKEILGVNGAGLIRSYLCRNCNCYLGKIENNARRFKRENLPQILRKVADYLEMENFNILHPTEKKKIKPVG